MNKPRFQCDTFDVSIEHPAGSSFPSNVIENTDVSLGGKQLTDVSSMKYSYNLHYDALKNSEYDDILELINHHLETGISVAFTYPKYPQTVDPVDCKVRMGQPTFKAGSGNSLYYITVDVIVTEINSRI